MSSDNICTQVQHKALTYLPDTIRIRRHLHMYPELSYKEKETCLYIGKQLEDWGIPFKTVDGIGIIADIGSGVDKSRTFVFRSDHDGLPIQERNLLDFRSTISGVSHMCGHDAHTACNLTSARILNDLKNQIPGLVRFVFQPGEELVLPDGTSGAGIMIEAGALENPQVRGAIAQHVNPMIPSGKIAVPMGQAMASVDKLIIQIKGKGGHAAMPENCIDPIAISSFLLNSFMSIKARMISSQEAFVLSFGKIAGGDQYNIIPDSVEILGTLRTLNEQVRQDVKRLIHQIAGGIASSFSASITVEFEKGPPSLINDTSLSSFVRDSARDYMGDDNVMEVGPAMTGEDFAFFSNKISSCFYWLGVRNESKGIVNGLHSDVMDIDEASLEIGSGLFAYLAFKLQHTTL
ncbi:MAG: M20 family metallopeptidase [Bacteroidetes bacterium]|nr:M20 family metallopeptidase [Bacteroidota bacterium]